jgi:pyruvyltransferase
MGNNTKTNFRAVAKKLVDPLRRELALALNFGRIPCSFCDIPNWGDALNRKLIPTLSGRRVQPLNGFYHDRYSVIGSLMEGANSRTTVWGSGFIEEGTHCLEPPRAVFAVRGPLTRNSLLKSGVNCPEIYGDPALLLPTFYDPYVEKRFQVGIIPHFIDKGLSLFSGRINENILIIDIERGIESVVKDIKACNCILSSSLHGLICADSYRIPTAWVRLSENVKGGDFKFMDYYLSIDHISGPAFELQSITDPNYLESLTTLKPRKADLRGLLLACPFLHARLRDLATNCEILPRSIDVRQCGIEPQFVD